MKACASSSSGKALASQAPQTTPPAAPEKPTRWSRSPQEAQPARCGAKPAASSSFRRKASELARPARSGVAVEQGELVGQQVVDAGVRVAVVEDARDRLAGARGAVERAAVLAQARVGGDGLDRGDREHVAAALVEHEVEAEERLEPPAEARLGLAHALGDRAHSSARRGIQVEDAVRFAVADGAQDDAFGFYRSGYRTILSEVMSQITVYTTEPCGYCRVAKALLDQARRRLRGDQPRQGPRGPRGARASDGHDDVPPGRNRRRVASAATRSSSRSTGPAARGVRRRGITRAARSGGERRQARRGDPRPRLAALAHVGPAPRGAQLAHGAPQFGHGSSSRRWTRNWSWKLPLTP